MSWKMFFTAMALVGAGCNASVEDPTTEAMGTQQDALTESVTATVTPGQCTTHHSLSTTASGFLATCDSKCLNDSSVTLRLYVEQFDGSIWRSVVMNYTGFAAKLGGSTSVEWPNASPGLYRGQCWVDYSDPNRDHFSGFLYTAPLEQAPTSDVTPPVVVMTSPASGTVSSGDLTVSANATDDVAVQKVEFYRDQLLIGSADFTAPYATSFTMRYLPAGTYSFHAKAYDAMGNVGTSASVTVTKEVCIPTTCAAQGKNCGSMSDGCDTSLFCGVCSGTDVCGGGGVSNVCATPPSGVITLNVSGRSRESVTSSPTGLTVTSGQTGTASFVQGTSLTLTASSGRSAIWSGACSSNGAKTRSCTFTVTSNASVSANIQ